MVTRWDYITDITEAHEDAMVGLDEEVKTQLYPQVLQNEARLEFQKIKKEASANLTGFDWDSYSDQDLARQAEFYFSSGSNITDEMLMEVSKSNTG